MKNNNITVSCQCGRNQILPVNQRLKNLLLRREEAIGNPTESLCIRFKKNYLASFFFFFFLNMAGFHESLVDRCSQRFLYPIGQKWFGE